MPLPFELDGRGRAAKRPVTPDEVALYREHGVLLFRGLVDPSGELGALQQEIGYLVERMTGRRPEHRFDDGLPELLRANRKHGSDLYRAVRKVPALHRLLHNTLLVPLVGELMGTQHPGYYPAGTGIRMDHPDEAEFLSPWHQEYPYNLTSRDAITVWMPIVDTDQTNGTLMFCPGSHQLGALPVTVADALNERKNANETLSIVGLDRLLLQFPAISVDTRVGDCLVFHTFLLHRSQPNRSQRTRWTLQARFFNFDEETAVANRWVGGMNEGNDLRTYVPELVVNGAKS